MRQINLWLIAVVLSGIGISLSQNYSLAKLADLKILIAEKTPSENANSQLPWEDLYNRVPPPRDDVPAGSRGDICVITPAKPGKIGVVWSDRPLFLWRGSIRKIEVRLRSSKQALWSQTVSDKESSIIYNGAVLEPGQSYDLVLFNQRSVPIFRVTFQIMKKEERERITSDLTSLEAQLKQEGATAEKIAHAKANYFASRGMWGDVLLEAYKIEKPSDSLSKFKNSALEQFCPRN
ncbi:hypothetical protein NIES2119_31710 [[Phormidium ambiguum] IAM M-71]|uniref:DUF928 domain-containing protein n=1 Tax=[Phormidium ambiguum] IAM M-71 TaxID=454136 RepID=A0A1U7I1Z2_9CYAN|nr:hypothetical protein [Phormidium ambiguum]OKH29993.1 hypothetical protein NIES2119_31710 [Phormidium ambiguum IAM M-71]